MPTCQRTLISPASSQQRMYALFNHLIGSRQQRRRNGEAEGLGGLQVYSQFEARGLFDRDISGLCASQYLVDVGRCAAEKIGKLLSVRQQKTVWDHLRDK